MVNPRKKRIMILGAGLFQLAGIKRALALGYHVTTVGYPSDNIGHRYSHQSVDCSIVDREGVLSAARELGIDGICTFSSDAAVPSVGHVCAQLGLPGVSPEAAEIMTHKHLFRESQHRNQLECPRFASGRAWESLEDEVRQFSYPVLFKPVDSSGSRGVIRLDRFDTQAARCCFGHAVSFSRSGRVCVEEWVAGVEVGGDAILFDGGIVFAVVTHKHMEGFIVRGHSLPTNITAEQRQWVVEALSAACKALDYTCGPLNFDVMIAEDRAVVLEMSPRNGGNGIPTVIQRATGCDIEEQTIRIAMGLPPTFPAPGRTRGFGSYIFGASSSGTLMSMAGPDEVKRQVPEVFEVFQTRAPGDQVEAITHNANLLGFALFDCPKPSDYDLLTARIAGALDIKVEP